MSQISNTYTFSGYAFQSASENILSPNTKTFIDGAQRIRSEYFTIKNVDSTARLQFSFDETNYTMLQVYESFSIRTMIDRFYVKSGYHVDTTQGTLYDASCNFITICSLKSTWW